MAVAAIALAVAVVMQYWPARTDPSSPDMHRRLTAVSELIGRTDPESLDTLVKLAADGEQRVAKASIRAIGARGDEPARKKLQQIVAENKSGVLRGTAAAELGDFEKTDYRLLTDMLLEDDDPQARAGAAKGLKRLHNAAAVDSLVEALMDDDADVRGEAFQALGRCTGRWFVFDPNAPRSVRVRSIVSIKAQLAIAKTTKEPAGGTRGLGTHVASQIDSLLRALSDSDVDVRRAAIKALGRITGRKFEFDPKAPPSVRAKSIAEIKKELERLKILTPGRERR